MNFITFEFLLFLVLFFSIYFLIPKKIQKFVLFIFNFYYISFYRIEFLYFILAASSIFYIFGILLEKHRKKSILIFSFFCTGGVLIYLKFFAYLLGKLHIQSIVLNSIASKLYLPLGISFYTLQGIAYIVDIYKNKYQSEKSFINFLLYMTFFPIFLQGPISRYE